MTVCVDTSFLVSLYGSDPNGVRADLWSIRHPVALSVWALNKLEFAAAIQQGVHRGKIAESESLIVSSLFQADLESRAVLEAFPDLSTVFRTAEEIAGKLVAGTGARSLDVLHVAAAIVSKADVFVTFDTRQARLATQAGLHVEVP